MAAKKWNDVTAFEEAKKFGTRMEFNKGALGAYDYLHRNRLLDSACDHMGEKIRWDFDATVETALFYGSLEKFRLNASGAYAFVHRIGKMLDLKAIAGFPRRALKYTDDEIIAAGKGYRTQKDFERGNPNMCKLAYTRNLMHLVGLAPGCFKYTDDQLREIAYKCSTKGEFRTHGGAYDAAYDRGLLDELCQHMPDGGGGFRKDRPGSVYQIRMEKDGILAWKHGITNTTVAARIRGFGLDDGVKWWIEKVIYFENGFEAAELEKDLKRRANPYKGPRFMRNGFTEVSIAPLLA
jgi:hypothetical protein